MITQLHFLKLPLAIAVASILLSACSTKPTYQPPSTVATHATAIPTTSVVTPTITQPTIAHSQPTTNQPVMPMTPPVVMGVMPNYTVNPYGIHTNYDNSSVLDAETLAILEDLLEARDMSMVEGDQFSVQRYGNLWDRVRYGYKISQPAFNERIEAQKGWFIARQSYLNRLAARASRYLYHAVTEAERRGIPTELALLPIIESSYDPSATSNAAAAGLWQFIPSTGRIYGLNQTPTYDGRRDVIESTRAAYDFLTSLYNQFGSWELALAAYNAGPGRIQRAIESNKAAGLPTDYWSLRLPSETMNYVPRFMAVAQIVGNPPQYGVSLPAIANHTHFRAVPVNYGTSLYDVSAITGVAVDELQLLNPALSDLRVDISGPNRVVIPNSIDSAIDNQLRNIGGRLAVAPPQNTNYVAVNQPVAINSLSTQELRQTNTLPTTTAGLTPFNTIVQEPPLSPEEVAFIAQQIKTNTPESVNAINPRDGKIDLTAVQTNQSVLDARGQKKSLQFDNTANSPIRAGIQSPKTPAVKPKPTGKQTTYIVKRGDNLSKIANEFGVSVNELAEWNQLNVNASLWVNTKLKLYDARPNSTNKTTPQRIESYTVQAGDTLTSVAAKHNLSVAQLASYNNLTTTSMLMRDQNLWLVDDKVAKADDKGSRTRTSKSTTYKVKTGDTLISLARELGVTTADIAALNNFDNNARLIQGVVINIPDNQSAQSAKDNQAKPSRQSTKSTDSGSRTKTEDYNIKSGDTLTSVAGRYNISIADLAKMNNLSAKAGLIAGQTIQVPKLTDTYTVKSGDTLTRLARRYGISIEELAKMNDIKPNSELRRGQELIVPNN